MTTWRERAIKEAELARDGLLKCEVSEGDQLNVSGYLQGIQKVLELFDQDSSSECITWNVCSEKQPSPGTRFLLRGQKTVMAGAYETGFLPDGMTILVDWSCFKDFVCWAYVNGVS